MEPVPFLRAKLCGTILQNMQAISRRGAVHLIGVERVSVEDCLFERIDGNGTHTHERVGVPGGVRNLWSKRRVPAPQVVGRHRSVSLTLQAQIRFSTVARRDDLGLLPKHDDSEQ